MRGGMLHAGGNISSGSHSGRMQEEGEEMMIGLVFISLPGGHGQPQPGFPRCPPAGAPGCWMPMQDIIFIFIPLNIALITFIFLALIERSAVEILLMFRLTFGNILERIEWSSLGHFPYFLHTKNSWKIFLDDLQPAV